MKSVFYLLFSILLMLGSLNSSAQIGIGTKTPAASAALEVSSSTNNKGILIPRITATQKDAIASPAEGLLVYQTTAPIGFYYYTGGAWKLMAIQTDLASKVDKVAGKDLSTNDYTTAEKTKLSAITGSNTGDQTTITGNAGTATKLAASKNINGVAFDGSSDITVPANAGTLTGIVAIANGGTNSTAAATAGGIGYGTGTAHAYTAAGTTGQVLSSNGAGVPTWVTPSGGGVPYTGATGAVNLGAYDLTVNSLTVGKGGGSVTNNTAIGNAALYANTTGSNNTAIGNAADVASGALTNATAIGNSAIVSASNTIQLGNTNVTNVKTSGTITAGVVTYPSAHGINGQVLTSTGSGTLTWTSAIGSEVTPKTATISDPFDFVQTPYSSSSLDVTTADNFSNGKNVLAANTSGIANVGIGINVLTSNTSGSANTSVGFNALKSNETGKVNSAFGSYALYNNTTGSYNTAIGGSALISNTTGSNNAAFGEWALLNNSTGTRNTASGTNALRNNTEGSRNTASGRQSLNNNTTGSYNTANGGSALFTNTTGANNTAIGYAADVASGALTNATAIGNSAIVSASNTIQLGNTDVTNVKTSGTITADVVTYPKAHGTSGQVLSTTGSGTLTWITPASGSSGVPYTGATGAVNLGAYDLTVNGVKIGRGAGNVSTNTAIGYQSLISNTSGSSNTASGYQSLYSNSSGVQNTANGVQSLFYNTTGNSNTASGYASLLFNEDGSNNTANGTSSLQSNTSGSDNTALGYNALIGNTTGSNNVGIGVVAGANTTSGDYNISIGKQALQQNTTGSSNVAVGAGSIDQITTGSNNVVLGGFAGRYYGTGMASNYTSTINSSILLGYDTRPKVNNGSNEIVIGTSAIGNGSNTTTIGGDSNTDTYLKGNVHVSNALKISGGTPGVGKVLTSDANGLASWVSPAGGDTHYIGESYGGGIVFYVYDGGKHGLIAATADQTIATGIRWYGGPASYTNTRARANGVGAGLKNTTIIIANQGSVDGNDFAATLCNEYQVSETVGGVTIIYGDWYLPSIYELRLLYSQKSVVGGLLNEPYWSSTEINHIRAWSCFFLDGSQNSDEKMFDAGRVRAIRAF